MLIADPRPSMRGFTLVELMVTVVIVAILASVALPSFNEFIRRGQIRTASEAVLNAIQLARSEAVKRNEAVVFVLGTGTGLTSWEVRDLAGGVIQKSRDSGEGGGDLETVVRPNGASRITFNGLGRVADNAPGGGVALTSIAFCIPGIVLERQVHVVTPGGQVRICDPDIQGDNDPRRCISGPDNVPVQRRCP